MPGNLAGSLQGFFWKVFIPQIWVIERGLIGGFWYGPYPTRFRYQPIRKFLTHVSAPIFRNLTKTQILKGAILKVKNGMSMTRSSHDVNFPFAENCQRSDCVLFIANYDPIQNRTSMLKGYQVESKLCNLTTLEISDGVKCVKLLHVPNDGVCLNIQGSGVSIMSGRIFYLRGIYFIWINI